MLVSRLALGLATALVALVTLGSGLALAAPVNDNFSAATIPSGGDVNLPGTTVAATTESGEQLTVPTGAFTSDVATTVWYRWTAPTSGTVIVDTCDITGIAAPIDSVLSVFTGSPVASLVHLVSNDDDANHCGRGVNDRSSSISFTATGANVYAFRVGNYNSGSPTTPGDFRLRIRTIPYPGQSPTISGNPTAGSTISTSDATWSGPTITSTTRNWQRCTTLVTTSCSVIPGQSGVSYVPSTADIGNYIRSSETATNSIGTSTRIAFSDPLGPVASPPAPANDNYVSAVDITGDAFVERSGHNINATLQAFETPEVKPATDAGTSVWYQLVAPVSGEYKISLCDGTDFDTIIRLYSGDPADVSVVGSNDDGCGVFEGPSVLTANLLAGTTYSIGVFGYQAATGVFRLKVSTKPYNVVPPHVFGSAVVGDGILTRYSATWGGPGPFTENGSWQRCTNRTSSLTCAPIPGATSSSYVTTNDDLGKFIRFAASATNSEGSSSSVFSTSVVGPIHVLSIPANDNFTDATEMTGLSAAGSNRDATEEGSEPDPISVSNARSVWFKWTATFTGPARFNVCDADFDSVLGIYTGATLAALDEVAAGDDGCVTPNAGSKIETAVVAGTTYRILVGGGYTDSEGLFTLQIENLTPPAVVNPPSGGGSAPINPASFKLPTAKPSKLAVKVKKSTITIPGTSVTCASATGPCTGTAKLTVKVKKKTIKLGTIKLSFKAGSKGSIKLKLSKSNAKKLKGVKKGAASAKLSIGAPGFAKKTATVKFTLTG